MFLLSNYCANGFIWDLTVKTHRLFILGFKYDRTERTECWRDVDDNAGLCGRFALYLGFISIYLLWSNSLPLVGSMDEMERLETYLQQHGRKAPL